MAFSEGVPLMVRVVGMGLLGDYTSKLFINNLRSNLRTLMFSLVLSMTRVTMIYLVEQLL